MHIGYVKTLKIDNEEMAAAIKILEEQNYELEVIVRLIKLPCKEKEWRARKEAKERATNSQEISTRKGKGDS